MRRRGIGSTTTRSGGHPRGRHHVQVPELDRLAHSVLVLQSSIGSCKQHPVTSWAFVEKCDRNQMIGLVCSGFPFIGRSGEPPLCKKADRAANDAVNSWHGGRIQQDCSWSTDRSCNILWANLLLGDCVQCGCQSESSLIRRLDAKTCP